MNGPANIDLVVVRDSASVVAGSIALKGGDPPWKVQGSAALIGSDEAGHLTGMAFLQARLLHRHAPTGQRIRGLLRFEFDEFSGEFSATLGDGDGEPLSAVLATSWCDPT
jgi:hypothetical protein